MNTYNYKAVPTKKHNAGLEHDVHLFNADSLDDARHWVINHLDTSCEWTVLPNKKSVAT